MPKMGLHAAAKADPIQRPPVGPSAITLGSDSVSPLTLASAYATVASGRHLPACRSARCSPSPPATRKPLPLPKDQCPRALEPDVAYGVTKILKTVLTKGTASGTGGLAGKRPVAGKTGTAGNKDGYTNETWFVGYTPQLSTAVWVGTPNDKRQTAAMKNFHIGGHFYPGEIFGATIAAPIWKQIMDRASIGMPMLNFAEPGTKVQIGDFVPIPSVVGMNVADATAALKAAQFTTGRRGRRGLHRPRRSGRSPNPARRLFAAATVVIITSAGKVPPPAKQRRRQSFSRRPRPRPRAPGGRPCTKKGRRRRRGPVSAR